MLRISFPQLINAEKIKMTIASYFSRKEKKCCFIIYDIFFFQKIFTLRKYTIIRIKILKNRLNPNFTCIYLFNTSFIVNYKIKKNMTINHFKPCLKKVTFGIWKNILDI